MNSNHYDYAPAHDEYTLQTSTQLGPTPAFLSKLWQLVNARDNQDLVCWAQGGRSFLVNDQSKFAKEILPNYFKHQKMNSFIRQLNMYGFKKVPKLSEGTLNAVESDQIEFANDYFIRGQPDLIHQIKRKDTKRVLAGKVGVEKMVNSSQLSELLQELSEQQKQTNRDFDQLKDENQDLYQQVGALQQKHDKQQNTVDRLISFMVQFIQQSGAQLQGAKMPMAIGGKRGGEPLMLGPSKRVNIEEYNEFSTDKNTYQDQNQLVQSYQGQSNPLLSPARSSSNQYFDLQLTSNEEEDKRPVVSKIQRSLSRQQSTLSSIIGMVSGNGSGTTSSNDFNFNLGPP